MRSIYSKKYLSLKGSECIDLLGWIDGWPSLELESFNLGSGQIYKAIKAEGIWPFPSPKFPK
jgi:hypothetical protein